MTAWFLGRGTTKKNIPWNSPRAYRKRAQAKGISHFQCVSGYCTFQMTESLGFEPNTFDLCKNHTKLKGRTRRNLSHYNNKISEEKDDTA